jgi:uncharacterized membrane protein
VKKLAIVFYTLYAGLTFILYFRWLSGQPFVESMTAITTVLGFGFAFTHGASQFGWKKILVLMAICFTVAFAFESIGVASGKIYGEYHYTASLGPKFLGLIPYIIPLAWFMMIYPALIMAQKLVRSSHPRGWKTLFVAATGGLMLTAWDLVMDPVMVSAGHWIWDGPASSRLYFGIPIENFLGWWVTAAAIFLVFFFVSKNLQTSSSRADVGLPVLMYATIGGSTIFSAYLSGLPGPALVGLMAMLPWVLAVLL